MSDIDAPGTLMRATIQLLKEDERTLPELAHQTGMPFYWLRLFASGKIPNPSVNRLQHLYEALTEVALPVQFTRARARSLDEAVRERLDTLSKAGA